MPPSSGKSANQQDSQPKGHELMHPNGQSVTGMHGATATAPEPPAMVYYYQDPRTGQRVASLLPPDHPQMVCLQSGEHVPETRYGFLGASYFYTLTYCTWAHDCALYWQALLRRLCGSPLASVCVYSIVVSDANAAASRLRKGCAVN